METVLVLSGTFPQVQFAAFPQIVFAAPFLVQVEKKINPGNNALPPGVVTLTLPLVPVATAALIVLSSITEKEVAETPPKLTEVAPEKRLPLIVITVPADATMGFRDFINT